MRHGYACENAWFFPGWWHTGENWRRADDEASAGVPVYAVADGEVVYADDDYPGRVVIIRHGPDLFSQYGRLDYELAVAPGDQVMRGELLGTVLLRTDDRAQPAARRDLHLLHPSRGKRQRAALRGQLRCGVPAWLLTD